MQRFYHKYLDHLLEVNKVAELKEKRMGAAESSKYVPFKAIRYLKFINSDLAYIGMNSQELEEEIDRIWAQYHTAKNEIKKKPELYAESYPVSAFVLFKSFNDRKRVINAF